MFGYAVYSFRWTENQLVQLLEYSTGDGMVKVRSLFWFTVISLKVFRYY
jgi:hypothetical protein